jgi:hypothetical protein
MIDAGEKYQQTWHHLKLAPAFFVCLVFFDSLGSASSIAFETRCSFAGMFDCSLFFVTSTTTTENLGLRPFVIRRDFKMAKT